jgi:hypothetical protein
MPSSLTKIAISLVALFFISFFVIYSSFAKTGFQKPPGREKIDLKVDSDCHYYNYDPQNQSAINSGELTGYVDVGCFFNGNTDKPFGTWTETDLGKEKFFQFNDIKPGDRGEDTVSLHVYGNDACGEIIINKIENTGNDCTEPETATADRDCKGKQSGDKERNGELGKNLLYSIWLDQGDIVGFQGKDKDATEDDNIFNGKDYKIIDWKNFETCPKKISIPRNLKEVRKIYKSICDPADKDGDGKKTTNGICNGIAKDGRMVESTTYYYGFGWKLPAEVGNEVQTDGLKFNLGFEVKPNGQCQRCNSCNECEKEWRECDYATCS